MTPTSRLATRQDVPALLPLIEAAIGQLQQGFLDPAQIASSRAIMGIDTQLIDDGTYFVAEIAGQLAGCGGWSRRATLYGGDHSPGRDAALLDPATEPAKVRAMYTHPRTHAGASGCASHSPADPHRQDPRAENPRVRRGGTTAGGSCPRVGGGVRPPRPEEVRQ